LQLKSGLKKKLTLKDLSNIKKLGGTYIIYTADPDEVVCRVVEFARRVNVKIVSINTRTPSLEDAFLKILGEVA